MEGDGWWTRSIFSKSILFISFQTKTTIRTNRCSKHIVLTQETMERGEYKGHHASELGFLIVFRYILNKSGKNNIR